VYVKIEEKKESEVFILKILNSLLFLSQASGH